MVDTEMQALRARYEVLRRRSQQLRETTRHLRRLASDLTLAEQRARQQIARTLHDQFQQILFGATLKLDRLARRLAAAPAADRELLERARNDVEEAIVAARSLAIELCPPALQEQPLPAALAWLADWMNQKYGLLVELHVDPGVPVESHGTRVLLFESVRELLFNVVKHARVDTARVQLTTTGDGAMRIVVADEGAGFDPAAVARRETTSGPGWGLFSIRERLGMLGGEFAIDSAPGRGTTFTLTVPRQPSPDECDEADDSTAGLMGGVGQEPLRVVIADDHGLVRDGLRELFEEHVELEVVGEAADGAAAVALALSLRPDVVVMDVSMPHMDGIEATRRIRAQLPDVQVFGLSTQEQTDSLHAIEQAGAAGYFTKGDQAQRLVDRLIALHVRRGEGRQS